MTTGAGRDTLRLFVAASLPSEAESAVRSWQAAELASRDDLRLTRSLHLTLCFLGDTPVEAVEATLEGLRRIPVPTLPVELAETLFLPERGRKRVVALRVDDPSGALVRLQGEMSSFLVQSGVLTASGRPYLPHLTVARFRRPGHPFSLHNVNFRGLCLPSVILYSSKLEKGGAVHTPLATFPAT